MDEGSLPHFRSVDKPEQLEEERRLAYVGFTRAMHRLYLVRAYRRSFFGDSQYTEPSRFLEDIPTHLVSSPGSSGLRESGGLRSKIDRRNSRDDDDYDYNQDTYSTRRSGRTYGSGRTGSGKTSTYGSGKAKQSSPSPQWSPRGSYSSPTVPPSSPSTPKSSSGGVTSSSTEKTTSSPPARPKGQQYQPGDRVRHDKFGEGVILKSEMEEDTEFVDVQFQGKHGKKRLSMDFAKLENL